MTGYTVHTGTSKKFTEGWDNIFEKKTSGKKKAGKKAPSAKAKSKTTGAKKKKSGKN
jgi:hypothetical protein